MDLPRARPRRNDENERGGNYTKSEFCATPPYEGGARGRSLAFLGLRRRGADPVRRMPPPRDERARRATVSRRRERAQRTRGREGEHFGAGSRSACLPGWRSDRRGIVKPMAGPVCTGGDTKNHGYLDR